jgi:RNA polymerase sigma-70 factor (ECF subfamily)
MTELTDEQIAELVQNGDVQSFGALVGRFEQKLLRYARRFLFDRADSQDLVQEVFLKAYINIQSFDKDRSFNAWIYRIAHNLFINEIKKKGKEPLPFFDPDTLFPHPVEPKKADDDLKEQELKIMMDKCLEKLTPKYREALILYYYEDMDYQKISDILQIPVSTVGVRLSRAKVSLRDTYGKTYTDINKN